MKDNSKWVTVSRALHNQLKIKRGLGRVIMNIAKSQKSLHSLPVSMNDGRILHLDLRQVMCMPYLFNGEILHEKGETDLVKFVVNPGETVIDIGTNVGWYSTLLSEAVGRQGQVFGFEPGNEAFSLIRKTAESYPQLEVNHVALGDYEGETEFYLAADRGQSSLKKTSKAVLTQKCRVTKLDSFLKTKGNPQITFIKCDAEGAELPILRGAEQLLKSEKPPIWMLEISDSMMKEFGYEPGELFDYFDNLGDSVYKAYRINSQTSEMESIPSPIDFRFDAVFVPRWQQDKIDAYSEYIKNSAN